MKVIKCSSSKQSYWIFTNLSTSLQTMKYISENISGNFKKYIDSSVYAIGKTIWLCNSYKFNHKTRSYENWFFKVSKKEFNSTLINFTQNCSIIPSIMNLQIPNFYKENQLNVISNEIPQNIINALQHHFNYSEFTIQQSSSGLNQVIFSKPYECFISTNDNWIIHESNNATIFKRFNKKLNATELVFKCYSSQCNQNIQVLETYQNNQNENKEEIIKNAINSQLFKNELIPTHSQWKLTKKYETDEFETIDLENYLPFTHLMIKSQMSTSKTGLMIDWLKKHYKNKKVVYISFRKSLTSDLLFNLQDLGFESYSNINKTIDLDIHQKVII